MIFWAGNTLLRLGHKLNRHVSEDPYTLADTLIRRQLQTKLYLPAHHPRAVNTLIECGNVGIAIEMLKRLMRWFENTNRSLEELYQEVGLGFLREQIVIQNEGVLIDPKK